VGVLKVLHGGVVAIVEDRYSLLLLDQRRFYLSHLGLGGIDLGLVRSGAGKGRGGSRSCGSRDRKPEQRDTDESGDARETTLP
jgi:hypothetical protein